jgi:hypothetical protein
VFKPCITARGGMQAASIQEALDANTGDGQVDLTALVQF